GIQANAAIGVQTEHWEFIICGVWSGNFPVVQVDWLGALIAQQDVLRVEIARTENILNHHVIYWLRGSNARNPGGFGRSWYLGGDARGGIVALPVEQYAINRRG